MDGTHLKNWLLRCKVSSERLRQEMAEGVELLSNSMPDYAAYRAVDSGCSLAADKDPGVRGLFCGKIWIRHWSQYNLDQTKDQAMATCKNKQMGAGLKSEIEGNLHAVHAMSPHSAGWEYDDTDTYGKDDIAESLPPIPPPVT